MIFTDQQLCAATGGRLLRPGPAGAITTDTRSLSPGDWFVALVGERFDGHELLPQALAAGCAGVIACRAPADWPAGFVQVSDTTEALQGIGAAARDRFEGPVVAITGSAGKTTTRALTALVLGALGPVHQNAGNLNSQVGVPLTLLAAPPEAAAWVIEMGMDRFGQIHRLQALTRPQVRLITNVGAAHLEGVGSLEGVARAKGELFAAARPGDTCCVNLDDPYIAALPLPAGVRRIGFGRHPSAEVHLAALRVDPQTLDTHLRLVTPAGTLEASVPSPGAHIAQDAAAAVAAGLALGLPLAPMAAALAAYAPVGMRQRIEAGPLGTRLINDAYNANPTSTAAALHTLALVEGARRVALLGDMRELGPAEEEGHDAMLALADSLGLDLIGLAGPCFAAAAARRPTANTYVAADALALGALLRDQLHPGDVVLLKGSRGTAMERVLTALSAKEP